jgi:hypothetical protein
VRIGTLTSIDFSTVLIACSYAGLLRCSADLRCKRRATGVARALLTSVHAGPRTQGSTDMPEGWSDKRERQYEHIKDSYEDRGVSKDEAEERAARTVNKERAEKGETKKDDD